ncbi:hypothetical protein M885DRAFT_520360 [Pelagophyceae sp. CCMP2097]|nr:hypothetical protein M885DRAFT_520360 [Pelagophyceae sp. CCMP2097]
MFERVQRLKERAIDGAINALDRTEDFVGTARDRDDDDAAAEDPFSDPRIQEWEDGVRAECRAEIELQTEAFEARIHDLEAERDAAFVRGAGGAADGDDVQLSRPALLDALRRAGVTLEPDESVVDGVKRLAAQRASSGGDESEALKEMEAQLEMLRSRFKASSAAHERETAQLREIITSARSLAGSKASEAERLEGRGRDAQALIDEAARKLDDARERGARLLEARDAANAACGAALREAEEMRTFGDEAGAGEEASRRGLRDARFDAEEARGASRVALQRVAALEADGAVSKLDAQNAATAHRNLEDVVRSLQSQRDADRRLVSQRHVDELAELKAALTASTDEAAASEDRRRAADEALRAASDDASKARAETRVARAAAATALSSKQQGATPPAPTSTGATPPGAPRAAAARQAAAPPGPPPKKGFASFFNQFVDDELGD